jgi:hypothetical protein
MNHTRWTYSLRLALSVAVLAVTLSACHKETTTTTPTDSPAQRAAELAQRKKEVTDAVSGVWKPSDGEGLLTFYASAGKAQMADGDDVVPVTLGDVDPDNQTVVIKISWATKDELRTLKLQDADGDTNHAPLQITDGDGHQSYYSFLRKVTNEDLKRISRLQTATPAPTPPAVANRGVIDMYLGGIDMNLRSCPGSTCSPVLVIPKDSKVSADTSTIRSVTESSGSNTPWVRVTYEGAYCTPAELDQNTGCTPSHGTEAPMTGWMNYTRLLDAPRVQQ